MAPMYLSRHGPGNLWSDFNKFKRDKESVRQVGVSSTACEPRAIDQDSGECIPQFGA